MRHDAAAFHTSDSARYLELGASLGRFDGFGTGGSPELFRLPGFPLLVAAAGWIGDPTWWTVGLHALIGAITTLVSFAWGRAVAGVRAGLFAAWLYACEPGQWVWSTFVLTETLFTALFATALCFATHYLHARHRTALLAAVAAGSAAAYVRLIGYVVPPMLVLACAMLVSRAGSRAAHGAAGRGAAWRDAAMAGALAVALLGAWHVRNGLAAGYWGFSIQTERAAYLLGGGVVEARQAGSYSEARRALQQEMAAEPGRSPAATAAAMRERGLGRVAASPLAFLSDLRRRHRHDRVPSRHGRLHAAAGPDRRRRRYGVGDADDDARPLAGGAGAGAGEGAGILGPDRPALRRHPCLRRPLLRRRLGGEDIATGRAGVSDGRRDAGRVRRP